MLAKLCALFMTIVSFFNVLTAGYMKYLPDNRIFLNQYYTEAKSQRQTYDLVFPKNASGNLGLVLCIHGGGWISQEKNSYTDDLFTVCEQKGVAAACINYRYVSDTVHYNDLLDDISAALTAIKAKAQTYGVNLDKVLLTGVSAGGHLSLLYAYSQKNTAPITPVCVVELCGPTDLADAWYYSAENTVAKSTDADYFRGVISDLIGYDIDMNAFDQAKDALQKASPISYVDADSVPTYFGHGELDELVPYANAVELDAALAKYGVEHTFVSFPNSAHDCEDSTCRTEIMKIFFDCIDNYLK